MGDLGRNRNRFVLVSARERDRLDPTRNESTDQLWPALDHLVGGGHVVDMYIADDLVVADNHPAGSALLAHQSVAEVGRDAVELPGLEQRPGGLAQHRHHLDAVRAPALLA